jgi:hypothetical protein
LKLPVHYQIEDIHADDRDNTLSITVSADDIPDSADLQATYVAVEGYSKGVWEDPESYRLADLKATYSLPLDHPVPDQKKGTGEEEERPRDE